MKAEKNDVSNDAVGNEKQMINVIPNSQYLKYKNFTSYKNPYHLSKMKDIRQPATKVDLKLETNIEDEDKKIHEVAIKMEIKATVEGENLFSLDISYAGLFTIDKFIDLDESIREQILLIHCPTLIFPYLRKEISTETVEGGYQPLLVNNIDFKQMYMQQKHRQENKSDNAVSSESLN